MKLELIIINETIYFNNDLNEFRKFTHQINFHSSSDVSSRNDDESLRNRIVWNKMAPPEFKFRMMIISL